MLKHQDVDALLRALAEPTRRAIVERLSQSPAAVGELAEPFDMSFASAGWSPAVSTPSRSGSKPAATRPSAVSTGWRPT
jgi:DNA-binding transcriptional ArsR family regulator